MSTRYAPETEPCIEPCDTVAKLKRRMAQRARNLLDPRYADSRRFPNYSACKNAEEYIATYETMNAHRKLKPISFSLGVLK